MSETKKRKIHTPEYKAKVALEALRSGKTINQIGQEFDVHPPWGQVKQPWWRGWCERSLQFAKSAQLR